MVLVHQLICLLLAMGLSALAVGLGSRLPNLREPSPAKIAAGFGGTLTLIVSALFVLAVVIPPAIPAYLWYANAQLAVVPGSNQTHVRTWFLLGLGLALVVSGLTTWIPLRIGFRAFRRLQLT